MDNFRYLYYLNCIEGLGPVRIRKLLDAFSNAQNVFESSSSEIERIDGFSRKTASAILRSKHDFPLFEKKLSLLIKKLEKINAYVLLFNHDDYPELLKHIYDPPLFIFCKGTNKYGSLKNSIAIVGTRRPTDYGKHVAEKFAFEFAQMGFNIVSGFARGVDTIVHNTVISGKNSDGITTAVLGCGIDIIYPPENRKLYEKIVSRGILLTEYEPGTKPDAVNFPKRNRIISGMSLGVIIIESGIDGGALITARCALDQSREVFAVPGFVTSKLSAGTNSLIKNGQAKLVENVGDILDELNNKISGISISRGKLKKDEDLKNKAADLRGNERLIYEYLNTTNDAVHIDDISEKTGLNISDCLVTLLNLEFKNYVKQLPGKRFIPL
jgi:DNA processing protein